MASTVVWIWNYTRRQPLIPTTVWPPDSSPSRNFWRYRIWNYTRRQPLTPTELQSLPIGRRAVASTVV